VSPSLPVQDAGWRSAARIARRKARQQGNQGRGYSHDAVASNFSGSLRFIDLARRLCENSRIGAVFLASRALRRQASILPRPPGMSTLSDDCDPDRRGAEFRQSGSGCAC
jgi:hypothetical protein